MEGIKLDILDLLANRVLISALLAMGSSQLFKAVKGLIAKGRSGFASFTDYGGFPSAHSAFISACTIGAALEEGFGSSTFAVAFVAACIIISDILRLRKKVEFDGKEIDRILAHSGLSRAEKLPQFAAHTKLDVIGGILWGGLCALIVSMR